MLVITMVSSVQQQNQMHLIIDQIEGLPLFAIILRAIFPKTDAVVLIYHHILIKGALPVTRP